MIKTGTFFDITTSAEENAPHSPVGSARQIDFDVFGDGDTVNGLHASEVTELARTLPLSSGSHGVSVTAHGQSGLAQQIGSDEAAQGAHRHGLSIAIVLGVVVAAALWVLSR